MNKKLPIINRPSKRFSSMSRESKSQKNLISAVKTLYIIPKIPEGNKNQGSEKLKINKHLNSTFRVRFKNQNISEAITPKKLGINQLGHLSPQLENSNKIESQKSIQLRINPNDNQESIIAHIGKKIERRSRNFISRKSPILRKSQTKQFNSTKLLIQNSKQADINFKSQQNIGFKKEQYKRQNRVQKGKIKMKLLGKNPLQKRIKFDKQMIQSIIAYKQENQEQLSESFKVETKKFIQMIDSADQSQSC